MTTRKIAVAGANGNLGTRIVRALRTHHADAGVVALVREGAKAEQTSALRDLGAEVVVVDLASVDSVARACAGATCVVSTIQGLRDAIFDVQGTLLDGAIAAKVPHVISSDFSTDYTTIPAGENRNFDLRREFAARIDAAPIAATSIFNGAFAEILTYNIPLLDMREHRVGYWEDADWAIDFTTMDDTAAFTAAAALDPAAPRALRIASFQVTPRALAEAATAVFGTPFALVDLGTRAGLSASNKQQRAANPDGEREVFPRWQQSQYMHSMFVAHNETLDNARYPGLTWTPLPAVLAQLRR
jgi:uncharacterized protein YbjT (DUF2867 family)